MTFKKLINSALLRLQQRLDFLKIRNTKSTTTSSDEISNNSSEEEEKVTIPDPPNWTAADYQYFWEHEKANYFESLGGSAYCGLNQTESEIGYSGFHLYFKADSKDHEKLFPNGKWAREFFNKKDISIEAANKSFRKMYATFRLICKIEDIARRLMDANVVDKCHMFYHVTIFDRTSYVGKSDYEECWTSLLKSSKVPLSVELRNQLKEANITESEFSKIISHVYMKLLRFDVFKCYQIEPVGQEDIIDVLADLNLDDNSYKSIKILFNLDEPVEWRLE